MPPKPAAPTLPKRTPANGRKSYRPERSVTPRPIIVLITGGSGSGKTWLADQLEHALGPGVSRLSLDDFYLDRSHLPISRRARLNFDHPRAIDWRLVEQALRCLARGLSAQVPRYDFKTHCRLGSLKSVRSRPLVLMDGLWLLRRATIRRLASIRIFLDCSARVRLQRRLHRDQALRGRTRASIEEQFHGWVEPMHQRFVQPQARQADFVFREKISRREVRLLAGIVQAAAGHGGRKPQPSTVG